MVADSRCAPVFANSLLCRFGARAAVTLVRSLSGEASLTGRMAARSNAPSNFDALIRVASDSGVYRVVAGAAAAFDADAWRNSAVYRWMQRTLAPLDVAARIRLAAWIWIVASLVHAALTWQSFSSRPAAIVAWSLLLAGLAFVWLLAPAIAARLSSVASVDSRRAEPPADVRFS
jgi:hypothetical protein